jgi:hypothetical protein
MFVTDAGTAEAASNILHVNGAGGATTSAPGNSNQIVITTAATPFTPNATLNEFDDFISPTGQGGKLQWANIQGCSVFSINGTAVNPGISSYLSNGPGNASGIALDKKSSSGPNTIGDFVLGGGAFSMNWVVQLSALSAGGNTYRFSCGLADATSLNTPTDSFVSGVYFQYTNTVNGGNWTINCTNASTTTTVNTATAAGTSFVNLGISVNAAGTSVGFTINGVTVGTAIITNIPTACITPFFMAINTAGTNPQLNADLWYMTLTLTTPR